jgi:predicted Fe-Mo cluster-binding NifX family protein
MKICVSSVATSPDAPVDPRFGRCQHFLIVDSETMDFEAIPNDASRAASGAGIQAAQTVVSRNVDVVLTGNVGPKAFQALSSAGVKIVTGAYGSVREAVERYTKGELTAVSGPTVGGHRGVGKQRGRRR